MRSTILGRRLTMVAVVLLILAMPACSRRTSTRTPTPTTSPTPVATSTSTATPTAAGSPTSTSPAPTAGTPPATIKAPAPAWTRQFGSPAWDRGNTVAVDREGNIIVGGATQGALPGHTLGGEWDAYLKKFSPTGTEMWSIQFTNSVSVGVLTLAVDGASNILAAGHVVGSIPGQTPAGGDDAYARKYTPEGKELWTREFGSPSAEWGFAVAADPSGNVIVVGGTEGEMPGQKSAGNEDAYVRKLSPDGAELWTSQFGSANNIDRATAVATDGSGNIIVAGRSQGAPRVDETSGVPIDDVENPDAGQGEALPGQIAPGASEAFVRKYTSDGVELWTVRFSSTLLTEAAGVAVDGTGNIIVVGHTVGALPGQTRVGSDDAFVKKLTPSGADLWTRQFGTPIYSGAMSVGVDASGNIVVAGYLLGVLPGQTRAGLDDAFVRKLSPEGDEIWTTQFGSPGRDAATDVAVDMAGNIAVVGEAYGILPGQNYAGTGDTFVLRLNQP